MAKALKEDHGSNGDENHRLSEDHSSLDSMSSSYKISIRPIEEFHFMEVSHSVQVLSGLNSFRHKGVFCDVTLCVQGQEFPCHKNILASFSPYFKAMFAGKWSESHQDRVKLKGLESSIVKLLLDCAYTSKMVITHANVQSLLSATNLLEILPVRDACCAYMGRHLDETNCLAIHCFAEAHACNGLKETAKTYTLESFSQVKYQYEFLHLPASKVIEFIRDDDLKVQCEEDVFEFVVRWHNSNDKDERVQDFHKVLEQVRLPLLSPYYLVDRVESCPVVMQCPKCRELVEEAKTYYLVPDRKFELRSPWTRLRKYFGIVEVIVMLGGKCEEVVRGKDEVVVLGSMESFDPHTLKWKTLALLPFDISKHSLVVSGSNVLYMAGGEFMDESASRSVFKYDPMFDTWQELAPMHKHRSELGLAMLDGYIYAVGGLEGQYPLDSVECYDPRRNTWHFVSEMKLALASPAVVSCNRCLYVIGGNTYEDGYNVIETVQCYDPKRNAWKEVAPMLIARSGSAACILNNLIYVVGGRQMYMEDTSTVEFYDPMKNEWRKCASMNACRYRPGVAVVDAKIYVCGGEEGYDRDPTDTIECYDCKKDVWEIVSKMPSSISDLSCAVLRVKKEEIKETRKSLSESQCLEIIDI